MKNDLQTDLVAETSVTINAPAAKVWKAIISPDQIKEYLMGTQVVTDWKEGSPISYEGEYNGKKYKDKGVIKKIEPEKTFQSTYWSSMGGKEDKPENYNLVTYQLQNQGDKTVLTLSQDNIHSEKEKEHATQNWEGVLGKLKKLVEENSSGQ
jgi:uncharacterized protein YndB with AHSA1/START domain